MEKNVIITSQSSNFDDSNIVRLFHLSQLIVTFDLIDLISNYIHSFT